jgi:hypothetical protein
MKCKKERDKEMASFRGIINSKKLPQSNSIYGSHHCEDVNLRKPTSTKYNSKRTIQLNECKTLRRET